MARACYAETYSNTRKALRDVSLEGLLDLFSNAMSVNASDACMSF
jgi:hypothetical protein